MTPDAGDDVTRADALRRHICCRLEAFNLYALQRLDTQAMRIEQDTDRVRPGLAELRDAPIETRIP